MMFTGVHGDDHSLPAFVVYSSIACRHLLFTRPFIHCARPPHSFGVTGVRSGDRRLPMRAYLRQCHVELHTDAVMWSCSAEVARLRTSARPPLQPPQGSVQAVCSALQPLCAAGPTDS